MLKIGEFSKLAQVSVKTLRYYDELGLLRPNWVDRYTGYRYYSLQQLPRLNRLLALRELGFPLVQIERMLREDLSPSELRRLLKLRQVELEHQVQAEQARLAPRGSPAAPDRAGGPATALRGADEAGSAATGGRHPRHDHRLSGHRGPDR
jgi:DNA-binding transcriptional MerR regulator